MSFRLFKNFGKRKNEKSTTPCGVCERRHNHNRKPSLVWCHDCDEGLCSDCEATHTVAKSSKKHHTISIEDYIKLPEFVSDIKTLCIEHNENFELYCTTHSCPCCIKCSLVSHNRCKEIKQLEEVILGKNTAFEKFETSFAELQVKLETILKEREENLETIMMEKEKIKADIQSFRSKININLDQLQKRLEEEKDEHVEKSKNEIQESKSRLNKIKNQVGKFQSDVKNLKEYGSAFQAFMSMKQIANNLLESKQSLQELIEDGSADKMSLSCDIDTELERLAGITSFGNIKVHKLPSEIMSPRKQNAQAQMRVRKRPMLDNISLQFQHRINIKGENITGCAMSPNGQVVFVNCSPAEVLLGRLNGCLETIFSPSNSEFADVTFINEETIAVTDYFNKCIILIDTKEKIEKKKIGTRDKCYGITHRDDKLIYCERGNGIQMADYASGKITTILKWNCPSLSYVSSFGENLYYTDFNHAVSCCDMEGSLLWTMQEESIFQVSCGVCADERGIVFVADNKKSAVIVVSADKEHKSLSMPNDLIKQPTAMYYDRANRQLLVANRSNKSAFVFKVLSND